MSRSRASVGQSGSDERVHGPHAVSAEAVLHVLGEQNDSLALDRSLPDQRIPELKAIALRKCDGEKDERRVRLHHVQRFGVVLDLSDRLRKRYWQSPTNDCQHFSEHLGRDDRPPSEIDDQPTRQPSLR